MAFAPDCKLERYSIGIANLSISAAGLLLNLCANALYVYEAFVAWRPTELACLVVFLAPILNGQLYTCRVLRRRSHELLAQLGGISHLRVLQVLFYVAVEVTVAAALPFLGVLYVFCRKLIQWFYNSGSHKNTAGGVAALRALANAYRAPLFHVDDEYAAMLSSPSVRVLLKNGVLKHLSTVVLERLHPGAFGHAVTRTKQIDQQLDELVRQHHVRQVVMMGAGYDMRALRLRVFQDHSVRVIELDIPEMSRAKAALVKKFGDAPPGVEHHFVPIDFNKQRISEVLWGLSYFDRQAATFYLWEGVQVYLPMTAVEATFAEVARAGAMQAAYLWLTLADVNAIQGKPLYGAKEFCHYAEKMGEPALSGLDPNTLRTFLNDAGFELVEGIAGMAGHMTPALKDEHFMLTGSFVRASEVFHNVLCVVNNKLGTLRSLTMKRAHFDTAASSAAPTGIYNRHCTM
eukprot:CAMPEP_0117472228 /NCGR_PEP_ID=MMETSP0784-20121206/8135_1 /TAXON_ID=39447 /ORGANISM="" /LENGTH=459 /DNA_ID=CAMNT_0005266365 /DNA_START=468 /DNA_END=1847 /DNA_ORIENTATION=-